ncbi:hypothetical protein ABB02_01379 [Clostridiaceae bacterium JG1575]|nr:hypothetical protein ABB02_01379 [Clostridiaceae bacterium JG1575]
MERWKRSLCGILAVLFCLMGLPRASLASPVREWTKAQRQLVEQNSGVYQKTDLVDVIVRLKKDQPTPSLLKSAQERGTFVQQERQKVERFTQRVEARESEAKILWTFDYLFPGVALRTTYEAALDLAGWPQVDDVSFVVPYDNPAPVEIKMNQSGPLVGAPSAWDLNFKGQGQLVAVIDSGADPSHRDFRLSDAASAKYPGEASILPLLEAKGLKGKWFNEKVPYGYNYKDGNQAIKEVAKASGMHGMHVAGTVAANGTPDQGGIRGIAPEAQLLILRVFGEAGGGTSSLYYVAAINDAAYLGADAINMSLGSPAGSIGHVDRATKEAIAAARDLGILVNIAAGNEGQFGEGAALPDAKSPDYGIVGTPALTPDSLAVASLENTHRMAKEAIRSDGPKAFYRESGDVAVTSDLTLEIVNCGLGTAKDFEGKELDGKAALIQRGETTFKEKVLEAEKNGAAATVIYNHEAGGEDVIAMSVQGNKKPALSVPRSFALELLAHPATLTLKSAHVPAPSPKAGEMSDFSNWGTTPDGDIKPEISAPGGSIWSTVNDNDYESMSGTSMATPHVAGACALLAQRMKTEFAKVQGVQKHQLIKNLLMSTARPHEDPVTHAKTSPRKQGAGVLNLQGALTSHSVVYDAKTEESKLVLHDVGDVFTLSAVLKNYGSKTEQYKVSVSLTTDGVAGKKMTLRPEALKTIDGGSITVQPQSQTTVAVTVDAASFAKDLSEKMPNGYFLEGFLHLEGQGVPDLSIPFVGFRGSFASLPLFDPFVHTYQDLAKDHPFYYEEKTNDFTHFQSQDQGKSVVLGEVTAAGQSPRRFQSSAVGISPNQDRSFDELKFVATFLRNYKAVGLKIYAPDGKTLVHSTYASQNQTGKKNHYSSDPRWPKTSTAFGWSWDGKKGGVPVADGTYSVEVFGSVYGADFPVYQERHAVKVDTQAPGPKHLEFQATTGRLALSFDDGQGVGVRRFSLKNAKGEEISPTQEGFFELGPQADPATFEVVAQDYVGNTLKTSLGQLLSPADKGRIAVEVLWTGEGPAPAYQVEARNAKGQIVSLSEELPLGRYSVELKGVPEGIVTEPKKAEAELKRAGEVQKVLFKLSKAPAAAQKITVSLRVQGGTYPMESVPLIATGEDGTIHPFQKDSLVSTFYDCLLPQGRYVITAKEVAKGWMLNPKTLSIEVLPTGQTLYPMILVEGEAGSITPTARFEGGAKEQPIRYQAKNELGQSVSIDEPLPFGTYEVAPAQVPEGLYVLPGYAQVILNKQAPQGTPVFTFRPLAGQKASLLPKALGFGPQIGEAPVTFCVKDPYGKWYPSMDQLPLGTYLVSALSYPREYEMTPEEQTVHLTKDQETLEVPFTFSKLLDRNEMGRLTLFVQKPWDFRGKIPFTLTGSDGSLHTLVYDSMNYQTKISLPMDYYTVTPGAVPEGFYLEEGSTGVRVNHSFVTLDYTVRKGTPAAPSFGSLTLQAKNAQGESLDGAVFQVRTKEGAPVNVLQGMPFGTYRVYVKKSPEGYRPEKPWIDVTLDEAHRDILKTVLFQKDAPVNELLSVQDPAPLAVTYGTPFAKLPLPETVQGKTTLEAGRAIPVRFAQGAYDPSTPGTYELTGDLTLPTDLTNPKNLNAKLLVTVKPQEPLVRRIVSLEQLQNLSVAYGTKAQDLPLPQVIRATLSDGTFASLEVRWDLSAYQGEVSGPKVLEGELLNLDELNLQNDQNLKAKIRLMVLPAPERTVEGVVSFPWTHLTPPARAEDAVLPTVAQALLSDASVARVGVQWKKVYESVGKTQRIVLYAGDLLLKDVPNVTNPKGFKASFTVVEERQGVQPKVDRIHGADRYETAAKISHDGWSSSERVVLASGENFADALTGLALAHQLGAPMLLATKDSLPSSTENELLRLGAKQVLLLGGERSLGPKVLEALKLQNISVRRLEGKDRYDTAVHIGAELQGKKDTVFLAHGALPSDALSIGSISAMKGIPVLYVHNDRLPAATQEALQVWGTRRVVLLGGEDAISPTLSQELKKKGMEVVRIGGATRYETNALIQRLYFPNAHKAYAANAQRPIDALTGSLRCSKEGSGLLFLGKEVVDPWIKEYIRTSALQELTLLGGPKSLSEALQAHLKSLLMQKNP